jgi:hypothetical protein
LTPSRTAGIAGTTKLAAGREALPLPQDHDRCHDRQDGPPPPVPQLECRITTSSGFHGAECPPVVAANPESGKRHVGAGPPAAVPHGTAMPDVDRAHAPQAVDELDRDRALTDHGRHALHGSVAESPTARTPEAGLQRQREATERRERVGTQIRSGQDEAIGITLDGRGSHSVCGRAPIIRKSAPALTFSTPWPAITRNQVFQPAVTTAVDDFGPRADLDVGASICRAR